MQILGAAGEAFNKIDLSGIILAAAAAGDNSNDIVNPTGVGLYVIVDITAITGTAPSLTVIIEGKDPASGKYFTLLQSAALNAVATTLLTVYPAAPTTANVSASLPLPRIFRIRWTIAGTTPAVTATIGAVVLK